MYKTVLDVKSYSKNILRPFRNIAENIHFFFNICNFLKNQSAEILEDKDIGNEKAIAGKTKNVGKSGKTDTNAKVSRD